jgi:hypothetical protein
VAEKGEHSIKCSICGRGLIVKDTVNNIMAFLSHLRIDHGITYIPQRMPDLHRRYRTSILYYYDILLPSNMVRYGLGLLELKAEDFPVSDEKQQNISIIQ